MTEPRWAGVRFIQGLLDGPPSTALGLSLEDYELGAGDLSGTPIEELVPDYGILDQINYNYGVHDAYFGYASRGCVRKCSFCGVPKLEGAQREAPPLTNLVEGICETVWCEEGPRAHGQQHHGVISIQGGNRRDTGSGIHRREPN